jgi:hypothetical protein
MNEQTNTETNVEQAERVVCELEDRRRLLLERKQELDESRKRLSFDAHTGDKQAKAALEKLNTEAQRHGLDVENILAAIAQANARLAIAQAAEAQEVNREHARELKSLVADLLEHAAVVDDALADVVTASHSLKECFDRLAQCGIKNPRQEQLAVMLNLSILTSLGQTPPLVRRYFQTLAPSEKRNFQAVMATWCAGLTRDADQLLCEDEPAKEVETVP